MNDSRRVLITGSTGFIGYEVARQLCAQGIVPRLLVRRPLRATILSSLQAERVQADLTSPASLHRAVQVLFDVLDFLQQWVLQNLLLEDLLQFQRRNLQQFQRLLQLRGHDQALRLTHLEAELHLHDRSVLRRLELKAVP